MPTLTPPTVPIASAGFRLIPNNSQFQSDLNRDSQAVALPGDRWSTVITVSNLRGREARAWVAFIASLGGIRGRFWLSPPGCGTTIGTALGSGVVSGSSQTGSSLVTSGWTASQTELLAIGDYFQVGNELKMVTATAASNGSGQATIAFTPPLRTSPANGASIVTANPACIMMLADDQQAAWEVQGAQIYAMTHSCIEALDI